MCSRVSGPTFQKSSNASELLNDAVRQLRSGEFSAVFIELCCEEDSILSAGVVPHVIAIRVTSAVDLTKKTTKASLHAVIRECARLCFSVYVWSSCPCTTGSPWQRLNEHLGNRCGDAVLSQQLITAAASVCRHVARVGGLVFWEWPSTSALWSCPEVVRMKQVIGASSVDLSSAALGLKFLKKEGDKVREM